jgi:very-short-patch-repair endonuclease
MKLLDNITEDRVRVEKTNEQLKKELQSSPNTIDLIFDDANFKYDIKQKRYVVTNYSCKIHPEWFKNTWTRVSDVMVGKNGCELCTKEKDLERRRLTQDSDKTLKEKLEKSPNTTGLTFNNVEFKRELNTTHNTNVSFIKNYSCKLHNTWFQNNWVTTNSVLQGNTGCYECGLDRSDRIKQNNQLIQQLKNSPYTTGLTFNDIEFDRVRNARNQLVIKIKNYSCKKHKWWKQNEWVQKGSVEMGGTGCKICNIENKDRLLGIISDVWDGKLDEDENSPYNKWVRKRNDLIQKNWLKISKKEHIDPETGKPKYGYDKVNFNDPNTIKYIYNRGVDRKTKKERLFEIYCPEPNHGYFIQDAFIHKKGAGCPICRESKGEKYLSNLFTNNKVKYVRGKNARLGGLIGKKGELLSDFYLTDKKVIVEYDGEQHFRPSFGSSDKSRMDNYIVTYTNDNNRDNFAKTNNDGISLIRISYIMTDEEINIQLFAALKKIEPNQIIKLPLGGYPKRIKPKNILHKNQVDVSQPIQKPRKPNRTGPKLSLMNTLKQIDV